MCPTCLARAEYLTPDQRDLVGNTPSYLLTDATSPLPSPSPPSPAASQGSSSSPFPSHRYEEIQQLVQFFPLPNTPSTVLRQIIDGRCNPSTLRRIGIEADWEDNGGGRFKPLERTLNVGPLTPTHLRSAHCAYVPRTCLNTLCEFLPPAPPSPTPFLSLVDPDRNDSNPSLDAHTNQSSSKTSAPSSLCTSSTIDEIARVELLADKMKVINGPRASLSPNSPIPEHTLTGSSFSQTHITLLHPYLTRPKLQSLLLFCLYLRI
ncbi:hypothetical protein C8R42DRAFT_729209 [Lentinula raphanica]|nr:hypothetical protein C8R42DRAFT_729209 [Lentinula raphanica]